ncbi:MobC family plasmid mobilization relaxosome protein [Actinomyces oricola]|uniref:MobC family plasmid mobilization relaxosome protein n=1 Tax=Actinomyces oricola TaxID=206043 RepID=UPI001F4F1169|nr:MobC family plasmid mobilization relaxosome protein [Actinomyces oricola]
MSSSERNIAARHDRRRSPRLRGGQRRSRLTVYLSPADRELLELRAQVSGESMAKFLVDGALRPVSADGVDAGRLGEVVALLRYYRRQLAGVATNLNQVARHANTISEVPFDFDDVVAQVHQLHDDINEILASVRR